MTGTGWYDHAPRSNLHQGWRDDLIARRLVPAGTAREGGGAVEGRTERQGARPPLARTRLPARGRDAARIPPRHGRLPSASEQSRSTRRLSTSSAVPASTIWWWRARSVRERLLLAIEGKADESFGPTVAAAAASPEPSRRPERVRRLLLALFGSSDLVELGDLRYQLVHAVAGTVIEAGLRHADAAVFVVHELVSPSCRSENLARNQSDLDRFVASLHHEPGCKPRWSDCSSGWRPSALGYPPVCWEGDRHRQYRIRGGGAMAGKSETLVSRLGLYDKLLECLAPGEDYVAYGVVEDRFCEMFPDEAHVLLDEKGHVWRDPSHRSTKTSMSRYLAQCLSRTGHQGRGGEERRARRGPLGIPRDIQLLATGLAAPYRSPEIEALVRYSREPLAGSLEAIGFAGDVWPLRNPLARPSLLAGGNNARRPRNSGSLRLRSSFLVSSSASPRVIAMSRPRSQRHCWRLRRPGCRLRRKLRQLQRQRPRLRRRQQRPRLPPRRPKW